MFTSRETVAAHAAMEINIVVIRYAHGWEVCNIDQDRIEVIERFSHEEDAREYAVDLLNDCVESAERAAGWYK